MTEKEKNSKIVCFQETKLKDDKQTILKFKIRYK